MLINESGRMLTQDFHLCCQPLCFCYRNEPGDVDPPGRPPSLLVQLLPLPSKHSQNRLLPPGNATNRPRLLSLAGGRKQKIRAVTYPCFVLLITIWPSQPPVSVTICFPPSVETDRGSSQQAWLSSPLPTLACELIRCRGAEARELPGSQLHEMQRWEPRIPYLRTYF